jgi:hypothetical protein
MRRPRVTIDAPGDAGVAPTPLADYYFADPRLTLVPIEHLSPAGMSPALAALLVARRNWTAAQIDLFNAAFALYWERTTALAERTRSWAPPRVRHVAIVHDPLALRPYAQLLNTSAWTAYACDFDPATSHPELAAYVLVHGDRMALTGEVSEAAVQAAAYWLERTDAECTAFAGAAARSTRPDADAYRALATALPWLRQLFHETLRPPRADLASLRSIPQTGLLVPQPLAAEPPALVTRWAAAARGAVSAYHRRWQRADAGALTVLCDWLRADRPPVLITATTRIVWDPEQADRCGALRSVLRSASGVAVSDMHMDVDVIAARTRAFRDALVSPAALPVPQTAMEQTGYTFLHPVRCLMTYNVQEPGMERWRGPALPYAREMLGARTIHEWAHLAVDAGWVSCTVAEEDFEGRVDVVADLLDAAIANRRTIPPLPRREHKGGSASAPATIPTGRALANLLFTRLPDFQANLLAQRFLSPAERETYVRHNIRTLRGMYPKPEWWRMLLRYLIEYQYLRFSAVDDRRTYFLRSTWFDADFIATGVLDDAQFDALAGAVARVCDVFAVEERWFRGV